MAKPQNTQVNPETAAAVSLAVSFVDKYKKALIGGVLAVVVIIAGVLIYKNFISAPREAKASTALALGQDYFATGDYKTALSGDKKGFEGFLAIASDYSSTDAGNLANLYAGLSLARLDKWEDAAKYLGRFDTKSDAIISPAAEGALGDAYAHLKEYDKAISHLKAAAKHADSDALSPIFLIQAGEILESQGKKADALELYQQVKDKYYQSMAAQTIDKYIERVNN